MATFNLRFYGRFVFAESPTKPGELKVLAINPGRVPGLGAPDHKFSLTVAQPYVSRDRAFRVPDLGLMAAIHGVEARYAEQAVWNLNGLDIQLCGAGFSWATEARGAGIPDIAALAGTAGFQDSSESIVSILTLTAGQANAQSVGKNVTFSYVPLGSPDTPDLRFEDRPLADMVEVTLKNTSQLRLELAPRGGTIGIDANLPDDAVVVCFSNICGRPSVDKVDREFAALYEVITTRPEISNRLVPKAQTMPFLEVGCYTPGYIRY